MKDFFGILFIFTKFSCDFFPCICRRIKGWSDDNSLHFLAKVYFVPVWTFWKRCEMWRACGEFCSCPALLPSCPWIVLSDCGYWTYWRSPPDDVIVPVCQFDTLRSTSSELHLTENIFDWNMAACTLDPGPCTLYPGLCTLDPILYTLKPVPWTLDLRTWTLEPGPHTLYPSPCTMDLVSCTLYPVPCTLYPYSVPSTYLVRPVQHCNLHFKDSSNNVKKVKSSKITEVTCETVRLSDGPR